MHQHPRPSPVTASPASSPRTNPSRTNNPLEENLYIPSRPASQVSNYNETDESGADRTDMTSPVAANKEALKKLDQIVQNFFPKAALLILQSRMPISTIELKDGNKKVNKWFSIETDDSNDFREELSLWRVSNVFDNPAPPLIIEIYINSSALTSSQALVIVDDQGKRWDVGEALNSANSPGGGVRKQSQDVILERWRIEHIETADEKTYDFGSPLPAVYKKCIVFFRSLYATTKFLPAWKFSRNLLKTGSSLSISCRILSQDARPTRFDPLTIPLYDNGGSVTTTYSLGETETPVGKFSAEVTYRNDCNFRVDDSEALLSSRFMGADEHFFQPSLATKSDDSRRRPPPLEPGSLPYKKRLDDPEPIQAYGSLSTFHGDAPLASSPISALRAAKPPGSDTSSPPVDSLPRARALQGSRASLVSLEGGTIARRLSTSFQPFKAGSLSSSPGIGQMAQADQPAPQSPQSLTRPSGIAALHTRNKSSLQAGMPATLRGAPSVPDTVTISPASSSPRPTNTGRYSSSFGHRRIRSSISGASRPLDEDQVSSGKQSLSSSMAQPGSGLLADVGGGSSGSLQPDDDNISDFLKMLDSKKTLQSFQASGDASTKRTSAQLLKFQSMRESNNALTESMSSSTLLNRSSTSSSRQLSSVPPMVAATSMSTSTSPGKPTSPHTPYTPHTPAIPSRLSAQSAADYSPPRGPGHAEEEEAPDSGDVNVDQTTNAIDIPLSPRPYYPHNRSSSTVARHRSLTIDDDMGDLAFAIHRSISLGAEEREPPTLSALLAVGAPEPSENIASTSSPSPSRLLGPAAHIKETSKTSSRLESQESSPSQIPRSHNVTSTNPSLYRTHLSRAAGGRGPIPPHNGSDSSLLERGSTSATSDRAGGRYSFPRTPGAFEADDDLLFDMSELGRDQSRRSIEEARGGAIGLGVAAGPSERGRFDAGRGGESKSRSRGGSRGGW
ncbi:autophagy protein-like protein Atg13 [Xylogone sp. PMI_703]|nr:autophagy protein-like protein Atg13 [Xylogone sp. PMI_703]